ncbi:Universal stress protein family protein [Halopelagius inordinatus]|uniref:Universal stress protein family protein n=1 Tax=Halopelagius inordinatus TaxID=553467 RepID=A0A1I2S6P3_9EURY|nr:HPP family protein [Halopelagius inordinatus]SFG47389.1 Universal stress protein family protein [Halopelagius inordinatus]
MNPLRSLLAWISAALSRFRRVERREASEFRRWLQNTNNLLHLIVAVLVPLLIAFVTYLSNALSTFSFLLFPPLAAGTFTLFSDPEGRYSKPGKFVAGLTLGALCGLAAFEFAELFSGPAGDAFVRPESAGLAVFLTALVTWAADVEAPSAFSTALLTLVAGQVDPVAYVVSIFLSSSIVAVVFVVWRSRFYEQRARYLYETVRGDDHVLVPMRGETAAQTALFGAHLAAAHEAGKVVLLDVVPPERVSSGPEASPEGEELDAAGPSGEETPRSRETDEAIERLESCASEIRTHVGVPCEVVVASGEPVPTTLETAENANCDLVVTPYEEDRGTLSNYVGGVFGGRLDAVAFKSATETRRWRRILVLVARPGDTAHAMIDFATRLAGRSGIVSVTTCIAKEVERRAAESRLANLVETAEGPIETRVSRSDVSSFVRANASGYDLLVIGSSHERSAASRFVSPPTFRRIHEADCDVAVFNRGNP